MTTENLAKFKINGTASADPVTGDKGYQTTALATLTLTLEQVPSAALSVTYYVYSSTDESSPLASKSAPALTFTASGTYMDTPASPNGTVELVMPATAAHSWNVRCVASTADGSDEYVRQVCIPYTLGVTDIFKTVPEETDEFYARGWSDKFNDYLAYIALFTIPTLDVSYDAGGAGLGRVVTVDSGAIEFNGSNAADYTLEVSNSGNGGVLYMDNTGTGRTFDIRIGGVASLVLDGTNNLAATCATMSLEATGAVALFSTAGLLSLSDGFQAGSTYASDLVLSDASAEWDLFEVNFGEVSILNAFNQCASSVVTLDEAYNASGGPSTITVDAGDVTWNEVGAYSFVVGLSGCTGAADGFFVEDGTDYFRLTHAAANALTCAGQFSSLQLDSAADISLDAATSSNFTITANDALTHTLTISAVNTGVGGTARIGIGADDDIDISSTAGRLTLNGFSSAGIGIEIEAVAGGGSVDIGAVNLPNQLNLGTGGVRPVILGSITGAAATTLRSGTGAFTVTAGGILDVNVQSDITIDSTAAGISLDAVASSNFSITDNSVNDRTLTLSATNAGAGKAFVDIYCDDQTTVRSTVGTVLIDAASNLELNSSGGPINIGNDAVAQAINLGTAGARTITVGNATGATALDLKSGTGGINLNDGVGQFDLDGAGALSTAGVTTVDLDCSGAMSLNSSAGVINIGNDVVAQNINIGTGGARTVAVGSALAAAITLDAIGGISLDSADNSNFTVSANAVADKVLVFNVENFGGGDATLRLYATDVGAGGATNIEVNAGTDITLDSVGVLELNSSAGVISIGNDAVAQNINVGTAGARTIAVGSATATAVTLDAIALSLDATDDSNFSVEMTSALAKELLVSIGNLGAGTGTLSLIAGGRACASDHFAGLAARGGAGSMAGISSDGSIMFDAVTDITFDANGCGTPLTYNDAVDTDLVGFASTSIVGALNELKEGYLAYGVYNVVANTYAFNDFTVSVILVDYTATGTCTVTIDSDQIAVSGRSFVIKDSGQNAAANNITVETEGAETIEGEANFVINTDGGWLTFVSDGTNLHLI